MNATPLELRKWFQILCYLLGLALAGSCYWVLRPLAQDQTTGVQLALSLLLIGALNGFERILTLFLPILLVKLWPRIESPDPKA